MPIVALEFYSGIGGLHFAVKRSNIDASVVHAFDWDQNACKVYEANHGAGLVQKSDISILTAAQLSSYNADLWLLSPSCQPYTVLNPLAKGAADPRAKSFIHLIEDVLPELVATCVHPSYLLVENVAGFETSSTRQRLLHILESLNYNVVELLLTPLQFGIPNSRLRYYLLAKARPLSFARVYQGDSTIWRHIPGCGQDWFDPRLHHDREQTPTVNDIAEVRAFLDVDGYSFPHRCAVPANVLEKWGRLFDIVHPSARRTCCFTRGYTKMAERTGSVLQLNEDLNTTEVFDRFLEAQTQGKESAVRILDPLRLRYFSPQELLRLFGLLPANASDAPLVEFKWPDDLSMRTQYRLIGNSVNVVVVAALIDYLFERN